MSLGGKSLPFIGDLLRWSQEPGRKFTRNLLLGAGMAVGIAAVVLAVLLLPGTGPDPEKVLKSLAQVPPPGRLAIEYPLEGTLFPPEISAPAFRWKEEDA